MTVYSGSTGGTVTVYSSCVLVVQYSSCALGYSDCVF